MKMKYTFKYEPRDWIIKLKGGEGDQWVMYIDGTDITALPEAPKNERALEEIHKSETLPNYTESKQ